MAERGLSNGLGRLGTAVKPQLNPMRHDHVSRVIEIERASFKPAWTDISFHILIDRGSQCWILEEDGCIAGYSVCQVEGEVAHILNLCVRRGSRGRGFGRMLLDHLLKHVRSSVEYALLEVRRSNHKALRLYLSSGFQRYSVKPGYYPQRTGREDAIVLVKRFSSRSPARVKLP